MKGISRSKMLEVSHITLKLHSVWLGMKQRCHMKSSISWKNYGGRGISVCNEWRYNAYAFVDWALTHGYKPGLTIDRIDVNGNYEPSNCRWATMRQQQNNTRRTIWLTYKGVKKPLSYWCDYFELSKQEIDRFRGRLKRYNVKGVFDELVMLKKYKERMASIGIKV